MDVVVTDKENVPVEEVVLEGGGNDTDSVGPSAPAIVEKQADVEERTVGFNLGCSQCRAVYIDSMVNLLTVCPYALGYLCPK